MSSIVIETHNLNFYFGKFHALKNVNLKVPEGSIFGFLGPNGAGKTTTIRLLLDLFHPHVDQVKIFGKDIKQDKSDILNQVGSLIENPSIYKHLSGRQNLELIRKMIGVSKSRIDEVLDIVRLSTNADKKAKEYSLGMSQRLGLAGALLGDPKLLILDEPTNGLDPSGIIEMRELLISLNRDHGKTIFLSSHILSEIEKLVSDIAIIDQGAIKYQGKIEGLIERATGMHLSIQVDQISEAMTLIKGLAIGTPKNLQDHIVVPIHNRDQAALINHTLVSEGINVYQLKSLAPSLEDIFLNITNKLDQ